MQLRSELSVSLQAEYELMLEYSGMRGVCLGIRWKTTAVSRAVQRLRGHGAARARLRARLQRHYIAGMSRFLGLKEKSLHCNKLTRDDRGAGGAGSPGQPRTGCCAGPRLQSGNRRPARCLIQIPSLQIPDPLPKHGGPSNTAPLEKLSTSSTT